MSSTPTSPAQDPSPSGQTPSAPDVDQPDGGTGDDGRTPSTPDNDQPQGGDDS